jgi:hypothetical protein
MSASKQEQQVFFSPPPEKLDKLLSERDNYQSRE